MRLRRLRSSAADTSTDSAEALESIGRPGPELGKRPLWDSSVHIRVSFVNLQRPIQFYVPKKDRISGRPVAFHRADRRVNKITEGGRRKIQNCKVLSDLDDSKEIMTISTDCKRRFAEESRTNVFCFAALFCHQAWFYSQRHQVCSFLRSGFEVGVQSI